MRLTDTVMAVPGVQGNALELHAEFEPGTAQTIGLKIRRSSGDQRDLPIAFDGRELSVAGAEVPFALEGRAVLSPPHRQ